ncbi:DUF1684 domain-containing protein [Plantactinospora endophytica]|uniref:DUF1684 domain-containing protein n=1 Tax=Plantactinospora endophytica TaxID=673535 RepID=A0ABQ4E239_9ACTN|nr:DUF1684 domain-containing protein [Plantactinospora endophytica]GIG88748.1 hypothetical protein Pen02_36840 [Plantactinospora endophytica]
MSSQLAAEDAAQDEWNAWHQAREAALTTPTGKLALVETRWLAEGEEPPPEPEGNGVLTTTIRQVDPVTGRPRHGIRRWDPRSAAITHFVGTDPYPYDPGWVVPARFVPAGLDHRVPFAHRRDNGATRDLPVPGHIEVTIAGTEYTVHAFDDEGTLLLVFGDLTNGRQTYGGGRFLFVPRPSGSDRTVLDFNRAHTPPCGFSAHFNCPLPPPQNRFPFAVEAGERLPVFRDGFTVE